MELIFLLLPGSNSRWRRCSPCTLCMKFSLWECGEKSYCWALKGTAQWLFSHHKWSFFFSQHLPLVFLLAGVSRVLPTQGLVFISLCTHLDFQMEFSVYLFRKLPPQLFCTHEVFSLNTWGRHGVICQTQLWPAVETLRLECDSLCHKAKDFFNRSCLLSKLWGCVHDVFICVVNDREWNV